MIFDGRTVLATTDLSPDGTAAVETASRWANLGGAGLLALHVVSDHERAVRLRSHYQLEQAVAATIEDPAAFLTKQLQALTLTSGKAARVRVEQGNTVDVIVDVAERENVSLIVTGSRGATGFRRMLLGSIAERTVRFAGCPVLVARGSAPIRHIVAATDFSDPALPALRAAAEAAKKLGAKLTLVHCIDPLSSFTVSGAGMTPPVPIDSAREWQALRATDEERLARVAGELGIEAELVVLAGLPAHEIVRVAEERDGALIVVGARGRTGIARLTLGSTAESVVRHAPGSVLVVRLTSTAG